MPRIKKLCSLLALIAAAFCIIYWFICGCAAGFGISALWIWPLATACFFICFLWSANLPPFRRLRQHKWLRITVALSLALVFCLFAVVECLIMSGMNEKGCSGLDYIIVLGAHVRGTVPSSALKWRIDRAYEYLAENPETVAVVSGGQGAGEDISEAECMLRELTALGIESSRIIKEDKSTSTVKNIKFSYELIGSNSAQIGIVTNNFHIWRAIRIAEKNGAENVCGIAAPFRNALLLHYMVREFFTVVANSLAGNM